MEARASTTLCKFLLLCKECNEILYTDESIVDYNHEQGMIGSIASLTLIVGADLQSGPAFCSFVELCCPCCQTVIGRKYQATTRKYDFLRNMFWILAQRVNVYILGNCEMRSDANIFVQERFSVLQQLAKQLATEISDAQNTIVQYESRLTALCERNDNNQTNNQNSSANNNSMDTKSIPSPQSIKTEQNVKMTESKDEDPEEIDLTQFGSSESSFWGDGWKLSLQWAEKHPPARVPKKRDCVVCKARCVMICPTCNVHLHTRNACYAKYHMNPEKYANDKGSSRKGHVCKACGKPRKGHPGKPGLKHCVFKK